MGLMACPVCGVDKTTVSRTVTRIDVVKRYRKCETCSATFRTVETLTSTARVVPREELLRRLRVLRERLVRATTGDRGKTRKLARDEAAETGEPVEQIYQRWGVQ